jgi:GAF domain-containing protein
MMACVLPSWLVEVPNAWLVVPLTTGNEMIAFVVLATARTRIDVNWEVNDLLKTAGRQAGAFLGQMQASEACSKCASSIPSTGCRLLSSMT